jgi:hypothetical protein
MDVRIVSSLQTLLVTLVELEASIIVYKVGALL